MDSLWHAFCCAALSGNGTLWQFIFYLRDNCLLPANLAYFDTMEETIQSMELAQNYKTVKENVTKACEQAGRSEQEVTLLAVSKTKPVDMLMDVYRAGARDFGENKVQELVDKIPQMPSDVRWHMIGHLQRNKVKYIVDKVYLIHSVDSLRLAEEISREAVKKQVEVNILIEVNVAQEESKFGTTVEETATLIREIGRASCRERV